MAFPIPGIVGKPLMGSSLLAVFDQLDPASNAGMLFLRCQAFPLSANCPTQLLPRMVYRDPIQHGEEESRERNEKAGIGHGQPECRGAQNSNRAHEDNIPRREWCGLAPVQSRDRS